MLQDFLIPTLGCAVAYDRASGYFSSALWSLISSALADFVLRDARMRLLCSPHLSEVDAIAVASLDAATAPSSLEIAAQSVRELRHGSDLQSLAVRCLSALVGAGVLELKFVTPMHGTGLFHSKTGIVTDSTGNRVAFNGSANETAAAWSGIQNHENIDVFRSWVTEDRLRVVDHATDFEELWNGFRPGWRVTDAKDARDVVIAEQPSEPIADVLAHLRSAYESKVAATDPLSLRPYQKAVLDDWDAHGQRGIVSFATGGGKTRVGLEAIRRWAAQGKPALALVPTKLLHDQWLAEIKASMPEANILLAGAGSHRRTWEDLLATFSSDGDFPAPRIVLSTYDTAIAPDFQARLQGGDHLLVVADEVHNFGARQRIEVLGRIEASARLGLSATPERYGDAAGTSAIFEYFGEILSPTFGIADALDAGVLVPYRYEVAECRLSPDETESWEDLSRRIGVALARADGELTEEVRLLLIRRSWILKRATAKAPIARELVEKHYRPGDRWLVYCGDVAHLREVREELADLALPLFEYHSQNEEDHEPILDFFASRGGILLAVKCLDEGVDIPLINGAIILASSTNPREYIQRRGRVLRKSPGKYSAALFDVLVVDEAGAALTPGEVTRGLEFAQHALNAAPLLYLERQQAQLQSVSGDGRDLAFEATEAELLQDPK